MSEYELDVRKIVETISNRGGVGSDEICDIVESNTGVVNCYPGRPGAGCSHHSFFVSLSSKNLAKGRGHLTFRKAIECLVQHMQGHCVGHTKVAIIISDCWDSDVFDEWRDNIEHIKKDAEVLAFLISGGNITQMKI